MKYTKKDLGSFNVHFIKTKKFKTITVKVVFHTPIKKEDITKRNMLSDILLQSSEKYDSRRSLTIESEELYAADLVTGNQRLGNYIFTSFTLQVLEDKYTEEENLNKSLEFLSEIIFHPDIKNNAFSEEKLAIVKTNTEVELNSIKEHATTYSHIRAVEAYDKNSPVSYRMIGYMEDLENINTSNLYETYQNMIDNDYVDIFVVGNYDSFEMLTMIKKYFRFKKVKKKKESYLLPVKKCRRRRLIARETIENAQSKLVIISSIAKMSEYERNYSLILANLILGGGPDSKLFKEVREKNSLCYSINSRLYGLDSLLIITAGIDKNNFTKTVDLITENIIKMKKGKFTDKDLIVAKEFFNAAASQIEESEHRMIHEILMEEILKLEPLKNRLDKINKVTKADIVKVCKKINMDTVFLLEGVNNE